MKAWARHTLSRLRTDHAVTERLQLLRAITGDEKLAVDCPTATQIDVLIALAKDGFTLADASEMYPAVEEFAAGHYFHRGAAGRIIAACDLAYIVRTYNIQTSDAYFTVEQLLNYAARDRNIVDELKDAGPVPRMFGWTVSQTCAALNAIPWYSVESRGQLLKDVLMAAGMANAPRPYAPGEDTHDD